MGGVYDLRTRNPYPDHITDAQWWFWEQLQLLAPGTQLGGFYADKAGYHNKRRNLVRQGRDHGVNNSRTDYSIRRAVDRTGPDDKSAACDWSFPEAWSRDYRRAATFGRRVKAAYDRRDSRLGGWREFLGQIDTDKSVAGEGLDFHTWTTRTPDSSHETHHHFSEDRNLVASFENKAKMISILAGYNSLAAWLATKEDEDMAFSDAQMRAFAWQYTGRGIADNDLTPEGNISTLGALNFIYTTVKVLAERQGIDPTELAQMRAAAQEGAQAALSESVDEFVTGVLAGLNPEDLTVQAVEQAVRNVLLRGAAPQADLAG